MVLHNISIRDEVDEKTLLPQIENEEDELIYVETRAGKGKEMVSFIML